MKIVQGVDYRHVAGYLAVVGRTKPGAERHSRTVGTYLRANLPSGTDVKPCRYKGFQDGLHIYEIPVIPDSPKVRGVLAKLVLQGDVRKN